MSDESTIRVIVVDDHELLRSGVRLALLACEEIEFVAEASDGQEALRLCEQLRPDVVLMDMKLPGMEGAEATRIIKDLYPETKVLVLTSFYEPERVQRAMQAGASGYLIKSSSGDRLADAIRETHEGRTMLSSEAADALVQRAAAPQPLGYDLTDTQREVLALMMEGLTNSEIGERMYLSPSTVSYHVGEILSKLGASNRAQASVLALRHGLVAE